MKLIVSASVCLLIFLLITGTNSCNRYIDKSKAERKVPVMQGGFIFYPDSNVLIYKSTLKLRMDSYIYEPKSFYVKLPKGLEWYAAASTTFAFYYNRNQIVAILMDIYSPGIIQDTSYVPGQDEISSLIICTEPGSNKKYDIGLAELKSKRNHLVIKKNAITVLLYNIVPRNYDSFVKNLNQFRTL